MGIFHRDDHCPHSSPTLGGPLHAWGACYQLLGSTDSLAFPLQTLQLLFTQPHFLAYHTGHFFPISCHPPHPALLLGLQRICSRSLHWLLHRDASGHPSPLLPSCPSHGAPGAQSQQPPHPALGRGGRPSTLRDYFTSLPRPMCPPPLPLPPQPLPALQPPATPQKTRPPPAKRPRSPERPDPPPLPTVYPPPPRHLDRRCKRRPPPQLPPRNFLSTVTKGHNVKLGLALSDIKHAGLGVFALSRPVVGTNIMEYGGVARSAGWVADTSNDVRYVWSDENMAEELAKTNRKPLYVDAHPAVSDSWGGRINDGFARGAHLRAVRSRGSDKVMLKLITPVDVGEELYLHYGPDYWQTHYHSFPPSVQQEAAEFYQLSVIHDTCYTPDTLRQMAADGLAHRAGGSWHLGPAPTPRPRVRLAFPLRIPLPPHKHTLLHFT